MERLAARSGTAGTDFPGDGWSLRQSRPPGRSPPAGGDRGARTAARAGAPSALVLVPVGCLCFGHTLDRQATRRVELTAHRLPGAPRREDGAAARPALGRTPGHEGWRQRGPCTQVSAGATRYCRAAFRTAQRCASTSRLSKRRVFRRPRPGEGGEKPFAFGRSARLLSSFFPSIRLNRGTRVQL